MMDFFGYKQLFPNTILGKRTEKRLFSLQHLEGSEKSVSFALAIEEQRSTAMLLASRTPSGALVQLVRIHACHAWGHGFESRTHRTSS